MKRFAAVVIGCAFLAGQAQARECLPGKPAHAHEWWSYRLVDGRACWYRGHRRLSKDALSWRQASRAEVEPRAHQRGSQAIHEPPTIPVENPPSFEERWGGIKQNQVPAK